ncbi:MAG TPA: ROK family protein [Bellilinea sp.]|nr:ROK family protein [Bellilinea sp.]
MSRDLVGAVDVGGTKVAVGVVDRSGNCLHATFFATTPLKNDPQGAVARISDFFTPYLDQLIGVGIGSTGPFDFATGAYEYIEYISGWEGFPLRIALTEALGLPVEIDNDANALALGEWTFGAGKGSNQFMLVTLGTGIGVSIILNGKVYRGVDGSHPEGGHHTINASEPEACWCGRHGCFEQLASGRPLEEWAQRQRASGEYVTLKDMVSLASEGDELSNLAIQRAGYYLGVGISNLISIWTPEVLCLGGGMMRAADLYLPMIKEQIKLNCTLVAAEKVSIRLTKLGKHAALIGASQVFLQKQSATL